MKVYATPTGRRYHTDALCLGLNAWYTANGTDRFPPALTLVETRRRGLLPCQVCKPAMLTVVR